MGERGIMEIQRAIFILNILYFKDNKVESKVTNKSFDS